MDRQIPDEAPGSEREIRPAQGDFFGGGDSRAIPTDTEKDAAKRRQAAIDTDALYAVTAAAVRKAGGLDEVVKRMDREPSYSSKVSEGLNRRENRKAHLDVLAATLLEPEALDLVLSWLSERGGYETPVKRRKVSREQEGEALLQVVAEKDPEEREMYRAKVARRLGVRIEDVKL